MSIWWRLPGWGERATVQAVTDKRKKAAGIHERQDRQAGYDFALSKSGGYRHQIPTDVDHVSREDYMAASQARNAIRYI